MLQAEGWVEHQKPAPVEPCRVARIVDQHFKTAGPAARSRVEAEPRGRRSGSVALIGYHAAYTPFGHFRIASTSSAAEAIEFVGFLVGRVDQHQAAIFLRGDQRVKRGPSVEMEHLEIGHLIECAAQRLVVGRMELDEHAPVLPPQDLAQDARRTGIDRLAMARPNIGDDRSVGREQFLDIGCECVIKAPDPRHPFAGASGRVAGKIVEARSRMGVDDPERRFLSLEISDDPHQQARAS